MARTQGTTRSTAKSSQAQKTGKSQAKKRRKRRARANRAGAVKPAGGSASYGPVELISTPGGAASTSAGTGESAAPVVRPKGKRKRQRSTKKKKFELECKEGEKIRFETQGPPEGYVFVPKGDVYITRNCRVQTHEAGKTVYVVHKRKSPTITYQTGLYVPSTVYDAVLALSRSTQATRLAAVAQKDARDARRAGALLRQEFPSMPDDDRRTVLRHAFLKGSGRVGRTARIEDEEKVRLAVEAHIRHLHTEYDELLDAGMMKSKARERVWEKVKEIRERWEEGKIGDDDYSSA